jgi:hypothetical protein
MTSELSDKHSARRVRKNIRIDSDSEMEEMHLNSPGQTGETPRNRVKMFMLDSETNEKSHSSRIWKDVVPDAEGSGIVDDLNRTTKKRLTHVILDSESETEEINLSSLVQKDRILDTKSITDVRSCGTAKNTIRGVMLNWSGAQAEQARCESKRVLSGSDSEGDISHPIKMSKTTFSVEEANTTDTEKGHSEEEINGSIYVQKHKRRIIVSDDEDS